MDEGVPSRHSGGRKTVRFMPGTERTDPVPPLTPRRWLRSAFLRWGYLILGPAFAFSGVVELMRGTASKWGPWSRIVMGLCWVVLAIQSWREPAFETTKDGVRWPGSKGTVAWAKLKPLAMPPDDGWTHSVSLDTMDGRKHVLPKMQRSELQALAAGILQAHQDNSGDSR